MKLIETKCCATRAIVRDLSVQLKGGSLGRASLLRQYRVRRLEWSDPVQARLDAGCTLLKSLHSVLQIGVYFTCGDKVAVFYRPSKQRDGSVRVTGSFSILKSWSPRSLHPEALAVDLARRLYFRTGPTLQWIERGVATTDIFESESVFAPHYLFLIFEIPLDEETCLDAKPASMEAKQPDLFVSWQDVKGYRANGFDHEFYDPLEARRLPVTVAGAIDRLLLTFLQRGDCAELEDTSRGLSRYYPKCGLIADTDAWDFTPAEVELDDHMHSLLEIVAAIRQQGRGQDVTLNDVVMFEPNFYGMGIRGSLFLEWIRQRFQRALGPA